MNSVLSYIAGFLVLLLFTALVGPSVIDWNSFRAEIEEQVSQAVGQPVTIGGDINFVILPAPRFSLQNVTVGPASTAPAPDGAVAEVATLEGEIALVPLLRGDIDVTRIRALNFILRLTRDENGRFGWREGTGNRAQSRIDFGAISLEAAQFENGAIFYRDALNGGEQSITEINGDLKAVSLLGPLRFDGEFDYLGHPYVVSASAGDFSGARAFPVSLALEALDQPWRVNFTGLATDASLAARLDGTLKITLGGAEGASLEETVEPVLSLQAEAVLSREVASFRKIEVTAAGSIFKGQAELVFEGSPSLSATLSGARFSVDRFFQELEKIDVSAGDVRVPERLVGSMDLHVSELGFGLLNATDVAAKIAFSDGAIDVQSLVGHFPGDANATLSGKLSFSPNAPRFDGSLIARVDRLPVFGRWLDSRLGTDDLRSTTDETVGYEVKHYDGPMHLSLRTELALQSSLLQAYSLSAVFGGDAGDLAPMNGGISLARSSRPALGVELKGPLLDLTFLGSLAEPDRWRNFQGTSDFDASLVIFTDEFRMGDWALTNLDVSAALNDGRLSVTKFEAGTNVGSEAEQGLVSISGSLSDLGQFVTGGLEGKISSALVVSWMQSHTSRLIPAVQHGELAFVLRGDREENRHFVSLNMNGTMDGSTASIVFKQSEIMGEAVPEKTDFLFSLHNQVAEKLTEQLGLGSNSLVMGEGALQGQLSGRGNGPFDVSVKLRAGDTSLSVSGRLTEPLSVPAFAGRFEASASQVGDAFAVAGLDGPLIDLIIDNGRQGAFIAGGALEWDPRKIAISELEAVAGTFRVSGAGTYVASETAPQVDVALELGRLNLDSLLATEDGSPWSALPLTWQGLADLTGTFDVSASSVEVAGLNFAQVKANASLAEGVLSFNPVTAEFGGGRLTMGGKLEGGEGVPGLGLTVALEDADVAAVSKMIFGVPLATGVATAGLQLQGQGRSLLGLVSTLSGKGTLTLGEGRFSGFDLAAFRAGVDGLETMDAFPLLEEENLRHGDTSYDHVNGDLLLDEGILSFNSTDLSVDAAVEAQSKVFVDLVRVEADVESQFTLAGDTALPPVIMVLAGPLHDLDRRTDTLALQSAVAHALLVREMEAAGVQELPEELRELIDRPRVEDTLDVPLDERAPQEEAAGAANPVMPLGAPVPVERPGL